MRARGAVWLTATRRGYRPERQTRPSLGEFGRALRGGIWALLFPVFLLLGLRMGVFTPSEIGAFAVVYAVVIGVVIHRKLGRTSFREALEGSFADVGAVVFLIALSAIFSYGIVLERIPEVVSGWILGLTDDLYGAMVLVALFVIAVGFFVGATVLIIMLTPIFLPLDSGSGRRSRPSRDGLHHCRNHRQLHATGWGGDVRGLLDPEMPDRRVFTRSRCRSSSP